MAEGGQSEEQRRRTLAIQTNMPTRGPSARHDRASLSSLYLKAVEYHNSKERGISHPCQDLYRDKKEDYYDDILCNRGGVMGTYPKDFHGDPKNPINGKLNGLFFSTLTGVTGMPRNPSIYGGRRLSVPWQQLLTTDTKLYFADFYCIRRQVHYVTLVVTVRWSAADDFCSARLHPLDFTTNPFLKKSGLSLTISEYPIVEVFYTSDVDVARQLLRGATLTDVQMTGSRSGGDVGIQKNSLCPTCNSDVDSIEGDGLRSLLARLGNIFI